jgi:aminoglycoside 3-N-acetyltransferase
MIFDMKRFSKHIDASTLKKRAIELWQLEYPQTFPAYHTSAAHTLSMLEKAGIVAEKISFPADGKTAWQDKITPLGWDIRLGRLTIVSAPGIEAGTIAADYDICPLHLIKGSTATAPGGETVRLLTESQVWSGIAPRGVLVLAESRESAIKNFAALLDLGVRGFVCDFSNRPYEEPYAISWYNAFTEHGGWHTRADDRDFIGFGVSFDMGRRLRAAALSGTVKVHIESDGRRYCDTIDVVTGLVQGRRQEEFWISAHLYEPLANDNSTGVVAAIETMRQIRMQGTPEFSLRVIFGLEHYGLAAYAAHRGNRNLSTEVIGAINYDAMYLRPEWGVDFRASGPVCGFYGNRLAHRFCTEIAALPGMPDMTWRNRHHSMYDEDTLLGDSTTGVPTVWPVRTGNALWHNSAQTADYVDETHYALGTALYTAFVEAVINPDPEWLPELISDAIAELGEAASLPDATQADIAFRHKVLAADFSDCRHFTTMPEIDALDGALAKLVATLPKRLPAVSAWRDYARTIVPYRTTVGLPFDLSKVPPKLRKKLPDGVIYGPLAALLADFDGRINFTEAIEQVELETGRKILDHEFKQLFDAVAYLAQYGYCNFGAFTGWKQNDIVAGLKKAGIQCGDLLCVHSSLSACGLVAGGAATVLAALREAVGEEGTLLFPTFTNCFVYLGGPVQDTRFRPYAPDNVDAVWTGEIPREAVRRLKLRRSEHPTHSWCGGGPLADAALSAQCLTDAPMAETSPLGFALQHGGKILHFGSPLGATTFLHYIEDRLNLVGVEDGFGLLAEDGGVQRSIYLPRNLPGDRDFYHDRDGNSKFFSRAIAKGLMLNTVALGPGRVRVLDMRQLYDIGLELASADPDIMLPE